MTLHECARYDAYIARVKEPFLNGPDTDENQAAMLAAVAEARRVWAHEAATDRLAHDVQRIYDVLPDAMREGTRCPRCNVLVAAPAHSCHVSRTNYVVTPSGHSVKS